MENKTPADTAITRRKMLGLGAAAFGSVVAHNLGCKAGASGDPQQQKMGKYASRGVLMARPGRVKEPAPIGLQPVGLGADVAGLLYIPKDYEPDKPAPFALMLHGAGHRAPRGMAPFKDLADEAGMILLALDSRSTTWDVIHGKFGPDVEFIDRTLAEVFQRYAVKTNRLAIEGFSDGASYALSLGLTNPALFSHIISFSPGFIIPGDPLEKPMTKPEIFISHGTQDDVLPIDRCSRRFVPALKQEGYSVVFKEFDGPHTVPPVIARQAVEWFVK